MVALAAAVLIARRCRHGLDRTSQDRAGRHSRPLQALLGATQLALLPPSLVCR